MDGRIKPLLLKRTIKMQLHVPCAFEFFENKFVHPAACFGQSTREHGETPAFFDIARRSEEFLWLDQRLRLDTARHDPALPWLQIVISAREPRDAVEQKHHVLFQDRKSIG